MPVHAAAAENAAGILYRYAAVCLGKDDNQDDGNQDNDKIYNQPHGITLGEEALLN